MRSHQAAKRLANDHLSAEGSSLVAGHATRHRGYDVWIVDYCDPAHPDEQLDGGALVVTNDGHVHSIGSTPDALDTLISELGRWPKDTGELPWPGVLAEECSKPYFQGLLRNLVVGQGNYPPPADVFAAFHLTPFESVRVVIVGQDPYPTPAHAMGLAFSVPRDVRPLPASLRNIHEAMRRDGLVPPDHGDLTEWARQGVLLLNTALTVPAGKPGAHMAAWRPFTDSVIRGLNARSEPVVFVLWGAKAQRFERFIDVPLHRVIKAPHPAARGAFQTRFRDFGTFSLVDQELASLGHAGIEWEAT